MKHNYIDVSGDASQKYTHWLCIQIHLAGASWCFISNNLVILHVWGVTVSV
jgi:hypothetical protein